MKTIPGTSIAGQEWSEDSGQCLAGIEAAIDSIWARVGEIPAGHRDGVVAELRIAARILSGIAERYEPEPGPVSDDAF